jgi:hypothetical protein
LVAPTPAAGADVCPGAGHTSPGACLTRRKWLPFIPPLTHLALFHISGYLRGTHLNLIAEMMAKETDPVAFDLAEVTLVDSEVVKFLAACDAKGIEIRNCPAFIREWMSKV